jgi:hypothetical protein
LKIKIFHSEIIDEKKFAKKIVKIYKALVHLENNKVDSTNFFAPNIRALAKYLKTFFSSSNSTVTTKLNMTDRDNFQLPRVISD